LFQKPPVVLKIVPKAALHVKLRGFFGHPMRGGLLRKLAIERQGNLYENSDAAFGTTSEVVIVFIEESKMFIFIFLFNRQHKKLKPTARVQKVLICSYRPSNK
jgi:hypothetical protein